MLDRIFPKQFDNAYRGHWLGIWLLVPIVLLRLVIGVNSMWHPYEIATTADAIPLDLYTGGGEAAAISMFVSLGFFFFLFALLGILVLIRYRTMIPLMYLLLLAQQLGSRVIGYFHPIVHASGVHLGLTVTLTILALTLLGFVLSLLKTVKPQTAS